MQQMILCTNACSMCIAIKQSKTAEGGMSREVYLKKEVKKTQLHFIFSCLL